MKYAVIQTGGKQYKVTEGSTYTVERLPQDVNGNITFSDVLLFIDGDSVQIGTPYVDGVAVSAVIVEHPRGEKIRVSKFKAKARYRRTIGHRQALSTIRVDSIGNGKVKAAAKPVADETKVEAVAATAAVKKATPKKATAKKAAEAK